MDDAGRHATLGLDTACANVPVPLDARRGPLQHCIVCMRHDVAMIAKARGPTTAFIQDHWVSIFSACAFAAHSSLQEVSEPWQSAMLFQSSLQLECEWAFFASGGEG
jgi:hypothetical protein